MCSILIDSYIPGRYTRKTGSMLRDIYVHTYFDRRFLVLSWNQVILA